MAHDHGHHHDHDDHSSCGGHSHLGGHVHGGGSKRSLIISLTITLGFMVVEAVGGWLTNSLALLSDAGHMLTDAGALGLSLLALKVGERPPSTSQTFGYRRFEILAALFNGLALWAIVGVILHEAYERLLDPPQVQGLGMVAVATLGLCVNLVSIRLLHAHKDENLNVKGAFLHVVADSLGSVGALLAGLIVWKTGWALADPLISLGICALILWSSWGVIRESIHILLLGVPGHIDYQKVQESLLAQEGICCIYDLHIWSINPGNEALSAHLVVPDGYPRQKDLLRRVTEEMRTRFGIHHATFQIEETHDLKDAAGALCKVGEGNACALPGEVVGQ